MVALLKISIAVLVMGGGLVGFLVALPTTENGDPAPPLDAGVRPRHD